MMQPSARPLAPRFTVPPLSPAPSDVSNDNFFAMPGLRAASGASLHCQQPQRDRFLSLDDFPSLEFLALPSLDSEDDQSTGSSSCGSHNEPPLMPLFDTAHSAAVRLAPRLQANFQ